ncbi:unnamed protein product, partial [Brassica oleracea]
QVLVDGLRPLIKESIIDFATGEELPITLEYEDLEYHCSLCNKLTHVARNCPMATHGRMASPSWSKDYLPSVNPPLHTNRNTRSLSHQGATRATRRQSPPAFSSRVDRHGKSFGERLPLPPTRGIPISNKIIPRLEGRSPRDTEKRRHLTQEAVKSTQERVWREKAVPSSLAAHHAHDNVRSPLTPAGVQAPESRPPLERNLAMSDFPQNVALPTREEVMEELREVTFQYTNCSDPTESAARRQRVTHSEEHGLMEETATRILAAAQSSLIREAESSLNQQLATPLPPAAPQRSTRPMSARKSISKSTRSRRPSASPHTFLGASLKKRRLTQLSPSLSRHGFPHASPVLPLRRRDRSRTSFNGTFVYGAPDWTKRQEVWYSLDDISASRNAAWFLT